jgi:riboflavin kinase / FMN adenylyltransferase
MRYTARVIPGRGEGRKLGFPTLNLDIPDGFTAEQGIYAAWAWIGDEKYPAAVHYGPVPVFGVEKASLEAHIIGQDIASPPQELVGLELVKYLRPVAHFEALEGLKAQIQEDIRQAREALEKV